MRALVWQWGRRGGAPRFAALLAQGLRSVPGVEVTLSLSRRAEILRTTPPPNCELPVETYGGTAGFLGRVLTTPLTLPGLIRRLQALRLDVAICALPGPLDLQMVAALRILRVKLVVVVHEAKPHSGDGLPLQFVLQRLLCRQAAGLVALTAHVVRQLNAAGTCSPSRRPLLLSAHPPVLFDPPPPPAFAHAGRIRLLSFGRLLPYKGFDLLVDALRLLGPRHDMEFRVVGQGPETPTLTALRALPGVSVENRWVPEHEVGSLLGWADALVLAYNESSQSGVAAAALAAGRYVVATRVGGLAEQLKDRPWASLCEPESGQLAAALDTLITSPRPNIKPVDAHGAWRDMAAELLRWVAAEIL